ncbi:MAG: hypothetical protein H6873_11055 [Hyphomicrobiaceae bacterium]|nr:hypothetical protein [Hyphomicrobiaceae bacterium]
MSAQDRLSSLRNMQAEMLCASAESALAAFVDIMNRETTLLRAGQYKQAGELSARKAEIAQDYVSLARAVQDQAERLKREAPEDLTRLQSGHEKLATQMAENLRVLATARQVTQDLISDVARATGATTRAETYGASGRLSSASGHMTKGLAFNQAL